MKLKSFCTSAAFILTTLTLIAVATTATAQTFTTLHSFEVTDGDDTYAGLVQGTDGNLYGTTVGGGASHSGTVYKITRSGTLTTLYSFCSQRNCTDGISPYAGLVQDTDGNFYGTVAEGGTNSNGTVFKITPSGRLMTLYKFCSQAGCPDGSEPSAGLIQAADGNLYGTTGNGGVNNAGTVFKITPRSTLTTLYSFCPQSGCPDGEFPEAGLIQATDGNFYGTTELGGANYGGTVFKITPRGTMTTLYSFCSQSACLDGELPLAGLVQASNGDLYGTTWGGGANSCIIAGKSNGCGTVFKITPGGMLTTLYSFCSQTDCTDGTSSYARLVQATDGNLYGTTFGGGVYTRGCIPNGCGTVFKITPGGTLTILHVFEGGDGAGPFAGLIQATDGNFYGTTGGGGGNSNGTVFRLSVGLGPFVSFQRYSGKVGQTGAILGQGFTGTTAVSFNGTAAAFTVVSDTYLTATVPSGAATGFVTVTTPSGTLKSNKKFLVRP